jgi:hypothetical protein
VKNALKKGMTAGTLVNTKVNFVFAEFCGNILFNFYFFILFRVPLALLDLSVCRPKF